LSFAVSGLSKIFLASSALADNGPQRSVQGQVWSHVRLIPALLPRQG